MASICNVARHNIRYWLKKHAIKWRNISESLLAQSDKVSERAKKVWSDDQRRAKQSETMKKVQSNRKEELSISAKKNWDNNRDNIIAGIRRVAHDPDRIRKISIASTKLWQDPVYKKAVILSICETMKNPEVRKLISLRTKETTDSESIRKRWANKEFKQKMIEILKERWKNPDYRDKMTLINRENRKRSWQDHNFRTSLIQALKKSAEKQRLTTNEFIERAENAHSSRFDYNSTKYQTWNDKIEVKCKACSHTFFQLPGNHLQHGYCPSCSTSKGQFEIFEFTKKYSTPVLNDRNTISPYEIDILIPKSNLGIEYNGLYWHSYNRHESVLEKNKHKDKMALCRDNGITLLQFFEHEWLTKREIIESMILYRIGVSRRLNARSLSIQEIDNTIIQEFFDANHLSGYRPAKHNLALMDNDKVTSAISLSRYKDGYEIIRFATLLQHCVRGGLQRLLSNFIKTRRPKTIYTFADLRYSTGIGYLNSGFEKIKETKPNYFYWKNNIILSRQRCQKHKLSSLLGDKFDPELSESTNMFLNGYRRMWDAGHVKFKLI